MTAAPGFLTLPGGRVEIRRIDGDAAKPTLVFLHEGLGSVGLWRDFPDRVVAATGCPALLYSRFGYGASDPAALPRPLSYMHDEALAVLPALLRQAGISAHVLVGHSDGGSIALIHAGGDPAAGLKGVVTLAAHVFVEDISVASIAAVREQWATTDFRAKLSRWHGANTDNAFRGWNDAWLDPSFRAWNIEAYLPRIRAPLLVIQGEADEYGTMAQVDAITAQAGGPVETLKLEACGHAPQRDQPDAVIAAIAGFVAGL